MKTYNFNRMALVVAFSSLPCMYAMQHHYSAMENHYPPVKTITTDNAPLPIGPYSQGVLTKPFETLYISGQIPIHPETQAIISDIKDATHQVMKYLAAILQGAEMNFNNVVKTTIYLRDMNDFAAVNEVYASYFNARFPARETVGVTELPKGASIEISMIAIK